MRPLLDRLQGLLALLPGLLRLLRLPAAALLPALRAAMVSLGVEGQPALKLLQEKAVRLLVAAFQNYPAQVWGRTGERAVLDHVVPGLSWSMGHGGAPPQPHRSLGCCCTPTLACPALPSAFFHHSVHALLSFGSGARCWTSCLLRWCLICPAAPARPATSLPLRTAGCASRW